MRTTKEPPPLVKRIESDPYMNIVDTLTSVTRARAGSGHKWQRLHALAHGETSGWMPASSGSMQQLVIEEPSEQPSQWSPLGDANVIVESVSDTDIIRRVLQNRMQEQLASNWFAPEIHELVDQVRQLIQAARNIFEKVEKRADAPDTVCLPIRSFAPEPFDVVVPIDVIISPEEDGFEAAFLDLNLHAYGESKEEAFQNLKSVILEAYQRLRDFPENRLGRSMRRQKLLLNHYLREVSPSEDIHKRPRENDCVQA